MSIKLSRDIPIAFGVVVLMVAPMLIVDSYKAHKSQQEASQMMAAKLILIGMLEDYQHANDHYPDSIGALSFTNSPQEIQLLPIVLQIQYRRTESGYALRYDGVYVHSSEVSNSH